MKSGSRLVVLALTVSVQPARVARSLPVAASQILQVWSELAVTTKFESELIATASTQSRWRPGWRAPCPSPRPRPGKSCRPLAGDHEVRIGAYCAGSDPSGVANQGSALLTRHRVPDPAGLVVTRRDHEVPNRGLLRRR